jgi:hypothetical protein
MLILVGKNNRLFQILTAFFMQRLTSSLNPREPERQRVGRRRERERVPLKGRERGNVEPGAEWHRGTHDGTKRHTKSMSKINIVD